MLGTDILGRHTDRSSSRRYLSLGLKNHLSDWVTAEKRKLLNEFTEIFSEKNYLTDEAVQITEKRMENEDESWIASLQSLNYSQVKYSVRRGLHPNDRGILWLYASGAAQKLYNKQAVTEYNFYYKILNQDATCLLDTNRLKTIMQSHTCNFADKSFCHHEFREFNKISCPSNFCPLNMDSQDTKNIEHVKKESYEKTNKSELHCCIIEMIIYRIIDIIYYSKMEINHCPMIYPIARTFWYFVESEPYLFACISAMLSSSNIHFFDKTTEDSNISSAVLRYLARAHIKAKVSKKTAIRFSWIKNLYIHDQLKIHEMPPQLFNLSWNIIDWPVVLLDNLKFPHLVRLIDCFLVEGRKVLYRAMIYFIYKLIKHIKDHTPRFKLRLSKKNMIEQLSLIISSCELPADKFIRKITKIPLKRIQIDEITQHFRNQLVTGSIASKSPRPSVVRESVDEAIRFPCDLLERIEWRKLMAWLPISQHLSTPVSVFSTERHGTRLRTLFHHVQHHKECIILVKTKESEIVGAYLSAPLSHRFKLGKKTKFFGCSETFIFTIRPQMRRYTWANLHHNDDQSAHHDDGTDHGVESVFVGKSHQAESSGILSSVLRGVSSLTKRLYNFVRNIDDDDNQNFGENLSSLSEASIISIAALTNPSIEPVTLSPPSNLTTQENSTNENRNISTDRPHSPSTTVDNKNDRNDLFIFADCKNIMIGGGGGNVGFMLSEDLNILYTNRCETFNNEPLTRDICPVLVRVDVYALKEDTIFSAYWKSKNS